MILTCARIFFPGNLLVLGMFGVSFFLLSAGVFYVICDNLLLIKIIWTII